jgi:hypothetical protein
VDAGTMHERSVSIFPSITPAATTSIITGCYPAEHGIAGASWFDRSRGEVAYYGDDFWVIAREGFGSFIRDFLLRLNGDRLLAPTLFEMVERGGRQAACLNYLVFRGNVPHRAHIPGLIAALPGVPFSETIEGPSILFLGDFVGTPRRHGRNLEDKGGILHRFGMDDASTGSMLVDLVEQDGLPDFTVAYFADNDYRSHEVGPYRSLDVLCRIDRVLSNAFAAAGGLDRFLSDTCILITSDHGHCDVLNDPARAVIRLDRVLGDYRQAKLGSAWGSRDEIMICPNMRAAQIYVRQPTSEKVSDLVRAALEEPLVDQVICRTALVRKGVEGYSVFTSRGQLDFARGGADEEASVDAFGGCWRWAGEAGALGIDQDGQTIVFDQYPNAFERIAGALDLDRSGEIWVSARPGAEFEVPGGQAHVGGASHGALHALDSNSPVIIAGGGARPRLPLDMRSIDIAPLCMQLLGLPMRYAPGDPR